MLVGIAAGSFFAPLIATITNWFDKNRGIAVSLVSAGVGVAPMTMSPFVSWLIATHDWRTTQMIVAAVAMVLMIPAALLVRPAPAQPETASAPGGGGQGRLSVGTALQSPQFLVLALTFFACCAMHSGPIFHTISYAMWCGVPAMAAVTIYSVEGLAGLGGRIVLGVLADRLGVKPVIVGALLLQAVAAGSFLFASSLYGFYAVASVFGFAYGGVMPLYAVLARGYFGPAYHRHGVRCRDDGVVARHGAGARGRRVDLRHLQRLHVALYRLVRDRPGGGGDRAGLPAVAAAGTTPIAAGVTMPKVSFTRALERFVKAPSLTVEGATLGEALDKVFAANPALRGYVLDDQGAVRRHVAIYINGQIVRDRVHLATRSARKTRSMCFRP